MFQINGLKEGTPSVSRIDKSAMVTISSMSVKPRGANVLLCTVPNPPSVPSMVGGGIGEIETV